MSEIRKIVCHQYATGRGDSGYGFNEYSRAENNSQIPSYGFSLSNGMNLRFSQLHAGTDSVLEIDPASTDYLHIGAIMTKNRMEAGSASVYTHILLTDTVAVREAFGLLKEGNFLTPEQFTEVTQGKRKLNKEAKNCELDSGREQLNKAQLDRLGAFLARYWYLLEQREWSQKDKPEIALIIPGKSRDEQICYFANEVVSRLPQYAQPAVSVSFGAEWNNRGRIPCVCCVLSDLQPNVYPYYDIGANGSTLPPPNIGNVEKKIGEILIKGDPSQYPQTYQNIVAEAERDDRFRGMARCYSTMAFCVHALLAVENPHQDPVPVLRTTVEKLTKLAEGRFGIHEQEIRKPLLPMTKAVFSYINRKPTKTKDDIDYAIQENIRLHQFGIAAEDLSEIDQLTLTILSKNQDQIRYLWDIYEKRDDGSDKAQQQLLVLTKEIIRCLNDQVDLKKTDIQKVAQIRSRLGLTGLENNKTYEHAEDILVKNLLRWAEDSFLTGSKNEKEEQYNTDHFAELIRIWQNGRGGSAAFTQIEWSVSSLTDAIRKITKKLSQGSTKSFNGCFQVLKAAERKLLGLHRDTVKQKNTVISAIHQCIRLRDYPDGEAKDFSKSYLILLSDEVDHSLLYEVINQGETEWDKNPDLLIELIQKLKENIKPNEKEITGFVQTIQKIELMDPENGKKLRADSFSQLIQSAAKAGQLSPEGMKIISQYILSQEQNKNTIQNAFEVGLNNAADKSTATAYLEQLAGKVLNSEEIKDTSFQNEMFRQIERASAESKIHSVKLDQSIESLLARNRNQVPVDRLTYCKSIAQARLNRALKEFFSSVGTVDPRKLKESWDEKNRDAYSCEWGSITDQQLKPLIKETIQKEYAASDNKIQYLTGLRKKVSEGQNSAYLRALESELIQKTTEEYDELWRNAIQNKMTMNSDRDRLDMFIDEIMSKPEYKENANKIKDTTAWNARTFYASIQELSRKGMNNNPEEAGELLEELRKNEGYKRCLRFSATEMVHQDDDLSYLVMMLVTEIAEQSSNSIQYWEKVLSNLKFDRNLDPWAGDGMRMLNILAYITERLSRMKAKILAVELKQYLGAQYLARLWSDKINHEFYMQQGKTVLIAPLFEWLRQ